MSHYLWAYVREAMQSVCTSCLCKTLDADRSIISVYILENSVFLNGEETLVICNIKGQRGTFD